MTLAHLDARPQPLGDLIGAVGTGFYIPLYQRPYGWTSENASRLIDDLIDGIVTFQRTGRSSAFLGSIITVDDFRTLVPAAVDRPNTVRQVIDGQQRIATLLGLWGELCRAIGSAFNELSANEMAVLKDLTARQSSELQGSLSFRIADRDDTTLPRMIRGGVDKWAKIGVEYRSEIARYLASYDASVTVEATESHAFDEVIDTMNVAFSQDDLFRGRVDRLTETQWRSLFLQEPPDTVPDSREAQRLLRLLCFAAFTMSHVQVISVDAKDEESAFAIFEPLNTTGEPLTAFETFLPLVVYQHGGQHKYADSSSRDRIERFRTLLEGQSAPEAAQRTKAALVAFALSDTGVGIGEQLRDQRLYLRHYLALDDRNQIEFLEGLADTGDCLKSVWYERHSIPTSSDRMNVALSMLVASRHTIPQALMIRGYKEFGDHDPELFCRLIRTVADFWLLWRLSRSTTSNIDGYYRNLMAGYVFEGSHVGPYCRRPDSATMKLPHPDLVAADFRTILRVKGGIDGREAWISKATEIGHGSTGNKALLRYALLGAYHDAIPGEPPNVLRRGAEDSSITLNPMWYDSGLTIEHIAPKTSLGSDGSFTDSIYRESRVHRLGNLTLVPQKENQILGSKSWPQKQEYFQVFAERDRNERTQRARTLQLKPATVDLLSRRFIPFCTDLAVLECNRWTDGNIADRGRCLAELIWDQFSPTLNFSV